MVLLSGVDLLVSGGPGSPELSIDRLLMMRPGERDNNSPSSWPSALVCAANPLAAHTSAHHCHSFVSQLFPAPESSGIPNFTWPVLSAYNGAWLLQVILTSSSGSERIDEPEISAVECLSRQLADASKFKLVSLLLVEK